ncbi:MAG: hypothetical protein WCH85_04765 [Methanomicrobiales archaeon]
MTSSDVISPSELQKQRITELAIPLLSFGSPLAGVLSWKLGFEIDFQYFAIGCLIASCLLAYLAWIRPKKDIVALSTPIYAIIFFVVPTDFTAGLTLQLLYAVSITLLLIRLKYRFGTSHTAVSLGKELAAPLKIYTGQTCDALSGIVPDAAHQAAIVISQFAQGEYRHVALVAGAASDQPAGVPALVRAFAIVHEHALILEQSLPRPDPFQVFLPEDEDLLANPAHPEYSEDRKFDAQLDNALLLLFSAAWHGAESDRPYLLSCQDFLLKLFA